jgi:hypothetical protein
MEYAASKLNEMMAAIEVAVPEQILSAAMQENKKEE